MIKKIAILGSTGSIGVNALRVIRENPDKYKPIALAAGKNIELLQKQIEEFKPAVVGVLDKSLAQRLERNLSQDVIPEILFGPEGFLGLSKMEDTDTVVSAMTGAAGLMPTFEAIKAGKHIALANKETIVMAGPLVMAEAARRGIHITPIDSEHMAIYQALQGHQKEDVRRIILTASGGPFRSLSLQEMGKMTPEQALKHPNWNMGPKISIDSATMMNKGLEVIEAKWLFDLRVDQINILIHPQSIVHSMVEYVDGSVIAQLGIPDMRIPISYALSTPCHLENTLPPLALADIGTLTFEKPDLKKFKCLALALEAADAGGTMPAVVNAVNEIAVQSFLEGKIRFMDIPKLTEKIMSLHKVLELTGIEIVLDADRWAREKSEELLRQKPF
jgi:1-deoxy-D-xylulose-5-phosphate reductoisomerase